MFNHYHLVIKLSADRFPNGVMKTSRNVGSACSTEQRDSDHAELIKQSVKQEIAAISKRASELRARFSSLSRFMRCLSEPIAELAKQEDRCKGRFLEERSKSQRLLDEK